MSINRLSRPVHAAPAPHVATDGTGAERRMPPAPGASDALRTALTERPQQRHAGEAAAPPRMALAKLTPVPPARTDSLVQDEVKAIVAEVCGDGRLRATHSVSNLKAATAVAWEGVMALARHLSPGRQ